MDEKDKTQLYGNEDKTSLYNSKDAEQNKTAIYGNEKINKSVSSQGVAIGETIALKGKSYTVKKIISEGTGEANVYQIESGDGQLYALKLYFEFKTEAEEPNSTALERIITLNDPDILKLIDYGTGSDKYQGKYCYEISEYAEGGNILDVEDFKKKYTPKFIEDVIIPQMYLAIKKLHEYKIYHCDLKPGNILYKDKKQKDIIAGDYGSAKAYDLKSEKNLRKSSTIKGTEFYLPPEQARGIVSEKNDYYSLGMVLLHLLYPEQFATAPHFHDIDFAKFEQIIERQYNLKPVVDFDPKYKRLNNLIEGLTLINHINRWGAAEFERWQKGETVKVNYRGKTDSDIKPLKIGPLEITTAEEFVDYINKKPSWFQDFFEDNDVFRLVKEWLDGLIGIPERKRFEKAVNVNKTAGKMLLRTAIEIFLTPQNPLVLEGKQYHLNTADNTSELVTQYLNHLDSIYKMLTPEKFILSFFQLEFALKVLYFKNDENKKIYAALLNKMYNALKSNKQIEENFDGTTLLPSVIKAPKGGVNYELAIDIFYAFNPSRPYPDNNGQPIKDAQELGVFCMKNKNLFDDKFHKAERNAVLKRLRLAKLMNASLNDLLILSFEKQAEPTINVHHISFYKLCNVHYSIVYKLDKALAEHGIFETQEMKEEKGFMYVEKNNASTKAAVKAFVNHVKKVHGDNPLLMMALEDVKDKFIKEHRRYFLPRTIFSTLITLFVLSIFFAIFFRLFS